MIQPLTLYQLLLLITAELLKCIEMFLELRWTAVSLVWIVYTAKETAAPFLHHHLPRNQLAAKTKGAEPITYHAKDLVVS